MVVHFRVDMNCIGKNTSQEKKYIANLKRNTVHLMVTYQNTFRLRSTVKIKDEVK